MAKSHLLAIASPGSRALKNAKIERYCRLRASLQPRAQAYREAGWETSNDGDAYSNACRLERRPTLRARIEYLSRQAEELIAEKRQRIEAHLWAVHDADIGAFWETYEASKTKDGKLATDQNGKMLTVRKQRAKLINDLPIEARKLIEDVSVDRNGNVIPKLYSKAQANADLRKLLNLGAQEYRPENDLARLSNEELIQGLRDQAKQLGVEIKLDYSFAQQAPATASPDPPGGEVVDHEPVAEEVDHKAGDVNGVADVASGGTKPVTRVAQQPEFVGARPVRPKK